jgi:glycosyltransferase involved in cell wall biosynthesis
VLFVNQTASVIGGTETWLDRIVERLGREGWRAVVGLVRGAKVHDPARYRRAHPALDVVEIDGRGLNREGRVRAVERAIRRVDAGLVVPLVVADAHEAAVRAKIDHATLRYVLAGQGNVPAQVADYRRLAPFADLAVGVGRLTTRLLEWAGVPADRVRHIPNGAAPPVAPSRPRARDEPIRVAYVGRLTDEDKRVRDLPGFCRALAKRGVPFSMGVVGDGPEREWLETQLAPLADRVRMVGARTPAELYETVFPELDVLVLFSESEAFGIVLLEALLHGVVPVSSRFAGHASEGLVRDGVNAVLFDVGDVEAAADAVANLAADPERLRALSRAARAGTAEGHDWDTCTRRWVHAFEDALTLPPRRPDGALQHAAPVEGRLERIGVPAAWADGFRRVRRSLLGVPAAMLGGEEWPWVGRGHDPDELRRIAEVRGELDRSGPPGA